jgi:hypothetical protein
MEQLALSQPAQLGQDLVLVDANGPHESLNASGQDSGYLLELSVLWSTSSDLHAAEQIDEIIASFANSGSCFA